MEAFDAQANVVRDLLADPAAKPAQITRALDELRVRSRSLEGSERDAARETGKQLAKLARQQLRAGDSAQWPERMRAALDALGIGDFRLGQREVIEHVLEGGDALVVMPTGGGKSLTYQVPSQILNQITVVVSPLIALMADQQERMKHMGAVMLTSAQSDDERTRAQHALEAGTAKVLLVAPERFASSSFVRTLRERGVGLLVVDEAHCLSEMGHDFRPDYLRLTHVLDELGRPPVLALTATATPQIAREIAQRLRLRNPFIYQGGFDRPNISFDVVELGGTGSMRRKDLLLVEGVKREQMRPAIVYCGTRKDTERVAQLLCDAGVSARSYHAGMDSVERARAQREFMDGTVEAVVATNAFGMGVDKANVRSVWHYALPTSIEAYYQEAGRAGRDGEPSHAVLLAMRADLGRLVNFNKRRNIDVSEVNRLLGSIYRQRNIDGSYQIQLADDRERIVLGVLERIGALEIRSAGAGGVEGNVFLGEMDLDMHRQAVAAVKRNVDIGWQAYRAIEAYAMSKDTCRRRQLLTHFGDDGEGHPTVRCCDVHAQPEWLIEANEAVEATLKSSPGRKRSSGSGLAAGPSTAFEDIAGDVDAVLLESLRTWRAQRSGPKPAYTVCNNATLVEIARVRPSTDDELLAIKGIGPSFIDKHAPSLLELLLSA